MWKKIAILLLFFYVSVGVSLYYFQEKIIFHPIVLAADYQFKFDIPFEEKLIKVNDKEQLSAILFKADSAKGIVLYFHGNARNVVQYAQYAPNFTKHGYDVLVMDYRKFGKSTGKLSEQGMYDDAMLMYNMARGRFQPQDIIIYGKSLGTGVAAELAAIRDCQRLILETPYYKLADLGRKYAPIYPLSLLMDYQFPTYEYLQKVTAPITIFHGDDDETVPFSSGEKLKPLLKKPTDLFVTIPGGRHNNLNKFPLFHGKLDSLLMVR
ncbi:hypothetical protein LX64_00437 [Chitinophaga skermanii]|uniref:Serine aminopeptidase S33 domain-containing protein n=2 Tax=Chitinophaga skermanii TaxID=331697 RepID=A0A327R2D9_9BACT|nr:hypothetical protein LX64_00437 [Chitinophaga skermanii]